MIFLSCSESKPDRGTVVDHHYTNNYFGIDLFLDPSWYISDVSSLQMQSESDLEIDGSMANPSIAMLAAFQDDPETASGFVPSFTIFAESLEFFPKVRTEEQFLAEAMIQATNFEIEYSIDQDIETREIGKNQLTSFVLKYENEEPIYQEYHAVIIKRYCVNFLLTYQYEFQKVKLYEFLESLSIYSKK